MKSVGRRNSSIKYGVWTIMNFTISKIFLSHIARKISRVLFCQYSHTSFRESGSDGPNLGRILYPAKFQDVQFFDRKTPTKILCQAMEPIFSINSSSKACMREKYSLFFASGRYPGLERVYSVSWWSERSSKTNHYVTCFGMLCPTLITLRWIAMAMGTSLPRKTSHCYRGKDFWSGCCLVPVVYLDV